MEAEVEQFLSDHQDARRIGPQTVRNYRRRLVRIGGLLGGLNGELTPAALRSLRDRQGWSPATYWTYWATVTQWTAWRLRTGRAESDPFDGMRPPAAPDPNPKPVSADQLAELIRLAETWNPRPERREMLPVGEWFTLAAYAGLRSMEIAQVEGRHLRKGVKGWELEIPHGKGGSSATVPAAPEVVAIFDGAPLGRLYPGATPTLVQQEGRRIFRKAGLPGGIHRLRHTFATAIYHKTRDPFVTQRLCRHKSLQSTLTYARVVDDQLRNAMDGLHG